jgi:hypothetical protein
LPIGAPAAGQVLAADLPADPHPLRSLLEGGLADQHPAHPRQPLPVIEAQAAAAAVVALGLAAAHIAGVTADGPDLVDGD